MDAVSPVKLRYDEKRGGSHGGRKNIRISLSESVRLTRRRENEIQVFEFTCKEIQKLCRDFLWRKTAARRRSRAYTPDDFEIVSCDSAGYVSELKIGNTTCTGDQFRDALSLPSSAFSVSAAAEDTGTVTVTTTGNGHGLGMSLWTAEKMAEEGSAFEEILAFFFEGTEIANGYSGNRSVLKGNLSAHRIIRSFPGKNIARGDENE